MRIYCSQLGMIVDASYCMTMHEGSSCRNIVGCLSGRMDIADYLKKAMGEEGFCKKFSDLPKTRLERIIELVNNSVIKNLADKG